MTNSIGAERVLGSAEVLRSYAEHFVQTDWAYTRNLGSLRAIRYAPTDSAFSRFRARLRLSGMAFFPRSEWARALNDGLTLRDRLLQAWYHLAHRERNLPDGVLDGGGVLTFWEETGEYLQLVQPSVGSLLADWMESEPENRHAQRVATEIQRILDAYAARAVTEPTDA